MSKVLDARDYQPLSHEHLREHGIDPYRVRTITLEGSHWTVVHEVTMETTVFREAKR